MVRRAWFVKKITNKKRVDNRFYLWYNISVKRTKEEQHKKEIKKRVDKLK